MEIDLLVVSPVGFKLIVLAVVLFFILVLVESLLVIGLLAVFNSLDGLDLRSLRKWRKISRRDHGSLPANSVVLNSGLSEIPFRPIGYILSLVICGISSCKT